MSAARYFIALGALFAALAVALGAFGAHALRTRLPAEALAVFQTAVQYQFWHALGVLGVGLAATQFVDSPWLRAAGGLLTAGIVLFCGSLYVLALGGPKGFGPVTPLGGVAFLLGWVALAIGVLR